MPIEVNGKENSDYANLGKLKARATFKILMPPLRAKTSEGWIDRPQTSSSFPATYTRRTADGKHETIRYYKSKTYRAGRGGVQEENYEPGFVTIEGGDINLSTVTDRDLYWFLKNHPHNQSNDIYDKEGKRDDQKREIDELLNNRNVPFEFYEVDRRKSAKTNLDVQRRLQEATSIVLATDGEDYIDNKQVALLCRAYGMKEVDDCLIVEDYDTLRNALLDQAKVDPEEFLKKLESAALHLEAMVQDAIKLSVIKYDQPDAKDGAWYWESTSKPIAPKMICSIPNAKYKEKEELLVSFLRLDAGGVSVSKRMKDEVQLARKAKQLAV